MIEILNKKYQTRVAGSLRIIIEEIQAQVKRKIEIIKRWKLKRIFEGWMEEVILMKI